MVIGYTPGNKGTDNRWTVTNHDAHAWVEAYFSGVGWAYFDPTPLGDGRTVAPAYAPRPNAADGPSSGSSASANPSAGATPNQIPKQDLNPGSSGGGLQGAGLITPRRLLIAGIVLVVLLVLLLPAFVRLSIRRRRMRAAAGADAGAAARAAWDEVVGSAADYGVPVPASDDPARAGPPAGSRPGAGRRGEPRPAAGRARRGAGPVRGAGRCRRRPAGGRSAVRQGLRGEAGRRRRWRAALLPPSTVRAARGGSATRAATASTALNRLGESIRRPVTPRRR